MTTTPGDIRRCLRVRYRTVSGIGTAVGGRSSNAVAGPWGPPTKASVDGEPAAPWNGGGVARSPAHTVHRSSWSSISIWQLGQFCMSLGCS